MNTCFEGNNVTFHLRPYMFFAIAVSLARALPTACDRHSHATVSESSMAGCDLLFKRLCFCEESSRKLL